MLDQEFATAEHPDLARDEAIATMPIGRLGTASEIAQVALFLASDAPRLLHGSALLVDGAKTIL
jgi:NAD(P)-dependent dehydrogenase (short-subunit alcohol dehydrogenase family)